MIWITWLLAGIATAELSSVSGTSVSWETTPAEVAERAEPGVPYYTYSCRFKQEFPELPGGKAECLVEGEFDSRRARSGIMDVECLNDVVVVYGVSDGAAKVLRNRHGLVLQGAEEGKRVIVRVPGFDFRAGDFDATLAIKGLYPATGFCQFAEIVEE